MTRLISLTTSLVLLATVLLSTEARGKGQPHHQHLAARKADDAFNKQYLQQNYQNGDAAPGAKDGDSPGQTVIINGNGGRDKNSQRPECPTVFIGTANVNGSPTAGWQGLPQIVGFDLDRKLNVGGGVQPVYIESNKDFKKAKRVVLVQPGLPRDSWSYVNIMRNSLLCAVSRADMDVTLQDVIVAAPAWLSEDDKNAGAAQDGDIYFSSGGWAVGSQSKGPGSTSVSSMEVLDRVIDRFFSSEFPNVASVIVAGHSLGASLTQRYAVLRRPSAQDTSVSYWIGNPGSYVWPVDSTPIQAAAGCTGVQDWSYSIDNGVPAYRSADAKKNKDGVLQQYFSRKVQYALGLTDQEGGDTHCEAATQGSSHLQRGQNLEKALDGLPGGKPQSHTFNYVADTAHEDYLMMTAPESQKFLFVEGLSAQRAQNLRLVASL
ncbi:hypothetical protein CBOM_05302 [Ceraceosorus bombacis]|uniref:Uncharacterized protein n=1 Tax=Ceraceosorus bombacis TaxID=401625 RepID=A0A0P1BNW0_9BASI|nr:hypothetical protein CBOM_05302 [Ceraceosorus bombacis]